MAFGPTLQSSNVLSLHLKQTSLPIIWIFTEGKGDGIKTRQPFKIFSTLTLCTVRYIAIIFSTWPWWLVHFVCCCKISKKISKRNSLLGVLLGGMIMLLFNFSHSQWLSAIDPLARSKQSVCDTRAYCRRQAIGQPISYTSQVQ